MGEKPEVSVVMPCYNSKDTIRQAIDSVYAQSVPVNLYVIDDCSSDGTKSVLAPYLQRDDFFYLRNDENMGVARSRMRGVAAADTPFIAFLDSDDWWEPEKLSVQLAKMKEKKAVLSSTGRELMKADGSSTGRIIGIPEQMDLKRILQSNYLNCSAVMVDRNVMLAHPMEHDDSHEDYISWIRIIRETGPAVGIDAPLLKYRLSQGGKSRNKFKSALMNFKVYRYCGYGVFRSLLYFLSYAICGVKKYYL